MRKCCLCTKNELLCTEPSTMVWEVKDNSCSGCPSWPHCPPESHSAIQRTSLLVAYCPHGMLGCHSKPLSFVFPAVHPRPETAMLVHILGPHKPRVPTAPAFALSGSDCSGAVKQREWSMTGTEVKAPWSPCFRVP